MTFRNQADRLDLLNFHTPPMRAFHCAWLAFFLCFFAWFGLAPLMPIIRQEMQLEPWQIGNLIVASVSATIVARLIVGPLCDWFGPRLTYSWLLVLSSLPVMGVGFARSYESLLLFRFAIGAIGASFVITQFHTSIMFSKRCVGTANAAAAGWGNLGGGVTQQVMPLVVTTLMAVGVSSFWAWRGAMFGAWPAWPPAWPTTFSPKIRRRATFARSAPNVASPEQRLSWRVCGPPAAIFACGDYSSPTAPPSASS
jgi:MFS transporter, NNP family, nitrate/nitrite transporter